MKLSNFSSILPLRQREQALERCMQVTVHPRRAFVSAIVLSLVVTACTNERTFRWQEEVVLSNGDRLLLDRSVRYRRSGEPFNPLRSGWAREDSAIKVIAGPSDLIGARYGLKDWIDPVVLDIDPTRRELVMVGTAWNCDWLRRFEGKARDIYISFHLRPGVEAEAISIPDWAWGRERNLYKPFIEIEPPHRVTPQDTIEHNKTGARGSTEFFRIDRTIRLCGGQQ